MRDDSEQAGLGYPASGRFGTALAPAPMVLTQELANTIGMDHLPGLVDVLDRVASAQQWLDTVVSQWCASSGVQDPHIVVTTAELSGLRAARDTLRAVISGQVDPDPMIAGTAAVTVTRTGARLEPVGSGASWLSAAIAIEAAGAHADDSFRRLKLCRGPLCRVAFYDRSKNNSRVWHDTATCGNQANVRAHRARRRQQ
jgi:predicted RNA-binding Zn ribbon-like protein